MTSNAEQKRTQTHDPQSAAEAERIRRQRIGEFFRRKRTEAGFSVEDVAKELELGDTTIVIAYETGAQAIPLDDIFTLTLFLNAAPEDVLALIQDSYNSSEDSRS